MAYYRSRRLKKRLLALALGLFLAAIVLESALQVISWIAHRRIHEPEKISFPARKGNTYRVMCLGDSHTYGVGAVYEKSYPRQLEELLNGRKDGISYEVINLGVPGQNSATVLKDLENNISSYRPDLILLLTGANNTWNLLNRSTFDPSEGQTAKQNLMKSIKNLKTYKLMKICIINLNRVLDIWRIRRRYGSPEKSARGAYRLATYYQKSGRTNLAISLFIKSLDLDPGNIDVRCDLAKLHIRTGDLDLAIDELEKAMGDSNTNPSAYVMLGNIYRDNRHQPDKALKLYREAITINPHDFWGHYHLGCLYHKRRMMEEARHELKNALEINPDIAVGHYSLSCLYREVGERELAIEQAKKGFRLDHNFHKARAYLLGYYGNDLARLNRDVQTLKKEYEAYMKKHHPHREIRYTVLTDQSISSDRIADWLEHDLSAIVNISRERGIDIVLMNYPQGNIFVETFDKAANNLSVPYVNLGRTFKIKLRNGAYSDYFRGHPTALGYKVMAESIYQTLIENDMLPSVNSSSSSGTLQPPPGDTSFTNLLGHFSNKTS